MTAVVHISQQYDVYIGRAGNGADGYFGNPHPIGKPCPRCPDKIHDRAECIAAFQQDFNHHIETDLTYQQRVLALKGKRLGCFCRRPGTNTPCHGDVLVNWLDQHPDDTPPTSPPVIGQFRGQYEFLSNPYRLATPMLWRGIACGSSEIAYQISKTDDPVWIKKLLAAQSLRELKAIGYALPLRPNWDTNPTGGRPLKVKVMAKVQLQKYQDPLLRSWLLATDDAELIEGNTWGDTYWGRDLRTGQGENWLGRLLMSLRRKLQHDALRVPPLVRPLTKVISGGQTGADQAGLATAEAFGIPIGGWAPNGWITSRGSEPALLRDRFRLQEYPGGYSARTIANAKDSDGTIRLAFDFTSPGERCTVRAVKHHNKPYLDVNLNHPRPLQETVAWITAHNIHVLNVAGNHDQSNSRIVFDAVCFYLRDVFVALGYERAPRA